MISKVNLTKEEWDMVWYWVSCYECPNDEPCSDEKLCKTCKLFYSIQEKKQEVSEWKN